MFEKLYEKYLKRLDDRIDWASVPEDPEGELFRELCSEADDHIDRLFDTLNYSILRVVIVIATIMLMTIYFTNDMSIIFLSLAVSLIVADIVNRMFYYLFIVPKVFVYIATLGYLEKRDNRSIEEYFSSMYSRSVDVLCGRRPLL